MLTSPTNHLQAKLAVRVVPLTALGGAREGYSELRLSVTCSPSTGRGPLASLRQNAVSYAHH